MRPNRQACWPRESHHAAKRTRFPHLDAHNKHDHDRNRNRNRNDTDHPFALDVYPPQNSLSAPIAMSNVPRSHTPGGSRLSTVPSQKPRQLSHLQAQLAQLTANMADLESLVRMTAGQAQDIRGLGGYCGAM